MADTSTTVSWRNPNLGANMKVDNAIVYALIKLVTISAESYNNQYERKMKYYQIRDLFLLSIMPFLVPKVTQDDWATRYFKITRELKDIQKLETSLEYFSDTIQETALLCNTILYSSGYYLPEQISNAQYEDMMQTRGISSEL